jgi:uncharacterized membrane protein (Fun14 family)
MEILGFTLPLWALFLMGIIGVIIAWKLIKFAIKIVLILIVFFGSLFLIDFFDVVGIIQQLLNDMKNKSLSTSSNLPKLNGFILFTLSVLPNSSSNIGCLSPTLVIKSSL